MSVSSAPVRPVDREPDKPFDPEVSDAVQRLAAGRDVEAKTAYERLSARSPENLAFSTTARLLEHLTSPDCSTTPTPLACPEVKR